MKEENLRRSRISGTEVSFGSEFTFVGGVTVCLDVTRYVIKGLREFN